ncbi:FABP family protein [Cellulomonas sp. URHE0023]|uniref:FABP family protein n=1 Tax=Cellulomonas sp. URHE0023 TaxID=1380354 RepID=UPI000486AFA3|nr:FABP family protein [Cellulomonas sp. URHE0023]
MPFVLPDPEGMAPEVYPLAWLVGAWRGEGVVDYPGIDEAAFTQDIVFDHDGGPYLSYTSTIRLVEVPSDPAALVDPEAEVSDGPVWQTESGYWRVPPERPTDQGLTDQQHPVEVLVADPSGHVGLFVGAVGKGRIDLVSDVIARAASGADVSAEKRLYGLVNGELMWAHDIAAFGHPMQSYASGRLSRVEADAGDLS